MLEIRKLLWVLLNFDCVTFYNFLSCLLYNDNSDNYFWKDVYNKIDKVLKISHELHQINTYSIFKSGCD